MRVSTSQRAQNDGGKNNDPHKDLAYRKRTFHLPRAEKDCEICLYNNFFLKEKLLNNNITITSVYFH